MKAEWLRVVVCFGAVPSCTQRIYLVLILIHVPLTAILVCLQATIAGGGVIPHIHKSLINKGPKAKVPKGKPMHP
jgi:hypothetical protein